MYDVQNEPSITGITIDKVGVKNLSYPITVRDRE
ncbi:MAG: GTP cyclohydrolase, FolE2/MptA family, partial [bacterium]